MSHSTVRASVLGIAFLAACLLAAGPAAAAPPEPGATVTLTDVETVLGGKFTSSSPEPGVLFYEEQGGGYRSVQIYLFTANGKTVQNMKAELVQQGEPVDDVTGVADAAMYRPQRSEATVEKKDKSGEVLWLSVAVMNAANAEATKRLAVELAKRGAARI